MKSLIMLILFTGFNVTFAVETPNDQPPVDHSTIFQHSNNVVPDTKTMRQAQVVSVLNTKGYTYIEVTKDDAPVWLAVPTTDIEAGDTVHYTDGPVVQNHHSRTLDRTFDSVIFLLNVVVNSNK
jgi:hypothetical protein